MNSRTFPVSAGQARPRGARRQGGFTLVELMVSMVLGLLVMVALIAVYLNVSRTNTEMAKTNGLIENGRFAIDILQEDIEHAGFWGGYVPMWDDFSAASASYADNSPAAVPDPCLPFSTWASTAGYKDQLIGIPIQAYSAVPSGCASPSSPYTSNLLPDKQANTDVLVVRHAEVCLPGVGNCEADNSSRAYFQASFCATELAAGNRYVLDSTGFTLTKRDCTTVADKRKFVSNIYYVRTYSVTAGDGIPTLMRLTFNLRSGAPAFESAVALIEGIEGFVVDLGIDSQSRCATNVSYAAAPSKVNPTGCAVSATTSDNTMPTNRGDGVPESYVRCGSTGCTAAQLRDVVAVKLHILARSREAGGTDDDSKVYTLGTVSGNKVTIDPAAGDKYRRHVFHTTVRLNNVSGRRETP